MKGKFIVIEGIEGAGKSTALQTIANYLVQKKIQLITTREPGGTKIGELVRKIIKTDDRNEPLNLKTELLLLYAARIQLVENVIKPALNSGCWVIADRFEPSSFAYQGFGRQIDENFLNALSKFSIDSLQPNLIIYLDVSSKIGLERIKKRGRLDRMESESVVFYQRVLEGYRQQMKKYVQAVKINASNPIEEVQTDIIQALKKFLVRLDI